MITIELTPRRLFVKGPFPEKELQKSLTFISSTLHEYQRRKKGVISRRDELDIVAALAHRVGNKQENPSNFIQFQERMVDHQKATSMLTEQGKTAIGSTVKAIIKNRSGGDISDYRVTAGRYIPATYTLWDRHHKSCPIGLLPQVEKILNKYQIPYEINDLRTPPQRQFEWGLKTTTKLRDFQDEALTTIETESIGLFHWATGAGKTIGFAAISAKLGVKTLIIVPSVALCIQTRDKFLEFTDIPEDEIGIFNGETKEIKNVTIAVQNSVSMHLGLFLEYGFEALHVDEAHGVTAVGLYEAIDRLECYYRYFWTGTPFRSKVNEYGKLNFEGEDVMIAAVACKIIKPIADYRTLRDKGYLANVTVESVEITAEDVGFVPEVERGGLIEIRNKFVKKGKRNEIFAKRALERWETQNRTTLIIVAETGHANDLAIHFPEGVARVITGNSKSRNVHLNEFNDKKFGVMIATSWVRQGVDIPTVDYVSNLAAYHGAVDTQQKGGRSTRRGTEEMVKLDAIVEEPYDAWHPDMKRHSRTRLEAYDKQGLNVPFLYEIREKEEEIRLQKLKEMESKKEQYAENTFREILQLNTAQRHHLHNAHMSQDSDKKKAYAKKARQAKTSMQSKAKQLLAMRRTIFEMEIKKDGIPEMITMTILDYLTPADQRMYKDMGGAMIIDGGIQMNANEVSGGFNKEKSKDWDDTSEDDTNDKFGEDVGEIDSTMHRNENFIAGLNQF